MPKRITISILLALSITSLTAVAAAQNGYGRVAPRSTELASAAQRLAELAALEPADRRFHHAARRLAAHAAGVRGRPSPHELAQIEQSYLQARRALVSGARSTPSEALLDAWEQVVVSYAPYRRVALPAPPPPAPPLIPPAPARALYEFEGRFEQTPIRLSGRTLEELDQACLQLASTLDTRLVDDVSIGARQVRNGPGYWDAQALCSIVALNASSERVLAPVHAVGSIEGVPFAVRGTRDVVARVLEQHIPRLTRQMRVDDIEIDARPYRNGPSFWTPAQIVSLIVSQLPPATLAPLPPSGRWSAQGTVERVPYSFQAASQAQLESQCRAFVTSAVQDWIDEIEVSGRALRAEWSYWSPEQACQIIANQATLL